MICVIAFCSKDADLQRRNLEWALELDAGCGREGVLSYDVLTSKADVAAIDTLAQRYFTKVHHCEYSEPPVKGWPAACNWAWQSTARWMYENPLRQPWLWLEADAMPLKSGWLLTLEEAFNAGGKKFGGHVVKDMGHMNGVGIYPWDVMARNEMAMLARAAAWDVVLKESTKNDCVNLNHLVQHAWNVHPIDRAMIWNGDGQPVSFKSQADVELYLDFNSVLLHRIKDGSLIPMLRERHNAAQEKQRLIMSTDYNVPQHTRHEHSITKGRIHSTKEASQVGSGNIVELEDAKLDDGNQSQTLQQVVEVTDFERNDKRLAAHVIEQCEILIVTYHKDAEWLRYCLALLKKYVTGFTGVTVAYPASDKAVIAEIVGNAGARGWTYDETPGKGMVQHMAVMALADTIVPIGTKFVCHVDADCMFHTPTTPADYFTDGKPDYLVRSWESLTDPASKVVSDCAQWFTPTAKQLGFDPQIYGMCRHPSVFPIKFYRPYREHVASVQKMGFMEYMISGKNEFPQDRQDWTAMSAWAYRFMRSEFHWIDIGATGAVVPKDRQRTFWSHGGVKPEIKSEIDGWLK